MTQVYGCAQSSPLSMPSPHDPNAEEYYTIQYRAPAWEQQKVYIEASSCADAGDLVVPLTRNGFVYECVSSGTSDSVEPTWPKVSGETVDDGTVKWKAHPDAFNLLGFGETIIGSLWEVDNTQITLSEDGVAGGRTYTKVSTVPATIKQFILTNRVTIQRITGFEEILDRSLRIRVKEM